MDRLLRQATQGLNGVPVEFLRALAHRDPATLIFFLTKWLPAAKLRDEIDRLCQLV